ncbi:MAG: MFS transporter [Variovorax sp.]|nr:MAG: MFS transporter [Variovorax sp.]
MTGHAAAGRTAARLPVGVVAVVCGGVSAALHLGKLPPAVPALQSTLGIGLIEAGFLLSLVQLAGMALGLAVGLVADQIGLRRSMLAGLTLLTLASVLGGLAGAMGGAHAVPWLLTSRAIEGLGFLLTVMPAPGLIRRLAPAGADKAALGLWGAYMPFGVALALLLGPASIGWAGWPGWWSALSVVSALAAGWIVRVVPADMAFEKPMPSQGPRLRATVAASGPWLVASAFAVYSAQWIAVIGFLPAIYAGAGVPSGWSAVLTAAAAAMNIVGNIAGGRWLQRGGAPATLLRWGFATMALAGIAAFAQVGQGVQAEALPPALRYIAVCVFSLGGGVVPATLFMLAVRVAPGPATVSTTVGLMQQASAFGQFLAPPAVAWIAHRVGGWQWTWLATLACSLVGIALAGSLARRHAATEVA